MGAASPDQISDHSAAIISSEDEIIRALRLIFDTEPSLDICVDMKNPLSSIDLRVFKALASEASASGKAIRLITEIDIHNSDYCRGLVSNSFQLRHLNDVSGLMIVGAQTFVGTVAFEDMTTVRQLITSTAEKVLLYQRKVFNDLWAIAVPAPVRFKELDSGANTGRHELIQNPVSVEDAYIKTLESANSQVLLMLPSVRAFQRQHTLGLLEQIKRVSSRGVEVRMLMPASDPIRQKLSQFSGVKNVKVHFIETDLNTRSTILVVDRNVSLVIEIRDDLQEVFRKAIGHATLSTVQSTVLSYTSLFDSYWIHAGSFEKLQRADRLKDEFINIAAHELRTPIMPIVGIVEVLMDRFTDPSQQDLRSDIEIIYRNADRLKRLAEDILNVSRIESGNFRLEIAECDIYSIIEESIQEIKGSYAYWSRKQQSANAKQKSIIPAQSSLLLQSQSPAQGPNSALYSMIMDIIGDSDGGSQTGRDDIIVFSQSAMAASRAPSAEDNSVGKNAHGLWIRCDPKKLKQVLYNLFSNALKFTDFSSASKIFVGVTLTDGGQVKISVKDRGAGIDVSIMDRIFERFASKSESGTGLGLYISKRIVESHGGQIWAENNIDGRGATFSFAIPISPFSILRFERPESTDRISVLQKEIEDRRSSLTHMRSNALQKISDMKGKLLDARDRAVKARDSAIEEYQKKVEASRGLLRVRQELLSEQINYNSMRRDIDRRVERGLEGLTTVIENLKGDLAGDEALDRIVLSTAYSSSVSVEAQKIIESDFFKSLQKQLGIERDSSAVVSEGQRT